VSAPVARALVCPGCRRGRLDPAGKRPGDSTTCPACGAAARVTLEMTLGGERILQRQSQREMARRTFGELDDSEKLEFIGRQGAIRRIYYFLLYRLGPRGLTGLYLGCLALFAALFLTYLVRVKGVTISPAPWWVWLATVGGGGLIGALGWLIHTTAVHYYRKHRAAAAGASPRKGPPAHRRADAVRPKAPSPAGAGQPLPPEPGA